jgi:hypothetical protein
VNPIVRLVDPEPSPRKGWNFLDWATGISGALVDSGVIAAILAALQGADLSGASIGTTFIVGFGVILCQRMIRAHKPGKPETAKKPVSDTDEFNAPTLGGGY